MIEFVFSDRLAAVEDVADDGVPDVRHVHADLVGASGFEFQLNEAVPGVLLADPVERDGCLAGGVVADRLGLADRGVLADGVVDHAADRVGVPVHDGQVRLERGAGLELAGDGPVPLVVLGHDQHAGGVLVEPVDDPRAELRAPTRLSPAIVPSAGSRS